MCKECGRQICPSSCPEFRHILAGLGKAQGFCGLWGSAVYSGDGHYRLENIKICSDCEGSMTVNELGSLLRTKEALLLCGFEKE